MDAGKRRRNWKLGLFKERVSFLDPVISAQNEMLGTMLLFVCFVRFVFSTACDNVTTYF